MEATIKETKTIENIKTFVFFDLESTGLSIDARMLELAMVAISRRDLLGMYNSQNATNIPEMPRVIHKFVKCFYPRKLICKQVEDICGLSNEALHHLSPFTEDSANSIVNFLKLPKPICLVAHNGDRFDFPLFKAELESVCFGTLDILCADTLPCIRALDTEFEEAKEAAEQFDEWLYSDDENNIEQLIKLSDAKTVADNINVSPSNLLSNETISTVHLTPKHSKVKNEAEPKVPKKQNNQSSDNSSQKERKIIVKKAKRRLVYSSYRQPDIYKRIFNSIYNAHSAEDDAIALLKIVAVYGKSFVDWCDIHSKQFSHVIPRCRFRIGWSLSQGDNLPAII